MNVVTKLTCSIQVQLFTGICTSKHTQNLTFCVKSQGHVSDENFLYYCMHLASKITSYGV